LARRAGAAQHRLLLRADARRPPVAARRGGATRDRHQRARPGAPVAAVGVDRNGCATDTTSTFSPSDSIYVVAPNSNVPQGTTLFVNLNRNNNAIEDAPRITADKDYVQNCINFVFQPKGANFTPGTYEAQFYINGNAASSVKFNIQ
jgi:hypothetical protein